MKKENKSSRRDWIIFFGIFIALLIVSSVVTSYYLGTNKSKSNSLTFCSDYSQLKQWCSDSCMVNRQANAPFIYSPYIFTDENNIFICACVNSKTNDTVTYTPVSHLVC